MLLLQVVYSTKTNKISFLSVYLKQRKKLEKLDKYNKPLFFTQIEFEETTMIVKPN